MGKGKDHFCLLGKDLRWKTNIDGRQLSMVDDLDGRKPLMEDDLG